MAAATNAYSTKTFAVAAVAGTYAEALESMPVPRRVRIEVVSAMTTSAGLGQWKIASAIPTGTGCVVAGSLVPATLTNAPTWADVIVPAGFGVWVTRTSADAMTFVFTVIQA